MTRYQMTCDGVDWEALEMLFLAAGLGGRKGDKIRRAFLHSQVVCFACNESHLIGAARALTDWEYHALIYDVAVHPDYQKQGIGQEIMRRVLAELPVWRVMLVAGGDVEGFYARFGFARHPEAMARFDWDRLYDAA